MVSRRSIPHFVVFNMFIESHEILKFDRGPESFLVSWGFTNNSILSTGAVEFEFEWEAAGRLRPEGRQRQADYPWEAASRLRPEGRQRQADNPWERQADCGPKADSGKPTTRGNGKPIAARRPTAASRQPERDC